MTSRVTLCNCLFWKSSMLVGTVNMIIIITKNILPIVGAELATEVCQVFQVASVNLTIIIITIIIKIVILNIIFTIKIILPIVGAELETGACQAFQCQSRSQMLGRRSRTHISRSVNHRAPLQSFGIKVVYHASKV